MEDQKIAGLRRTNQSRSSSPFISGLSRLTSSLEEEENSVNVIKRKQEKKITKTSTSSDEIFTNLKTSTPIYTEKSTKMTRHRTSDYSSEDGETPAPKSFEYNTRQRSKFSSGSNGDVVHSTSNGSNSHEAYQIYKQAGEYWNKYPKTDYTYSRYSPHRRELAPGVIAMPNMSRRSLHSLHSGEEEKSYVAMTRQEQEELLMRSRKYLSNHSEVTRRRLEKFTGRDELDLQEESIWLKILRITYISTIITWLTSLFTSKEVVKTPSRRVHISTLQDERFYHRAWNFIVRQVSRVGSIIYTFLCYVLLLDCWLLSRKDASQRTPLRYLFGLILLPLLLCAGLWLFVNRSEIVKPVAADIFSNTFGGKIFAAVQDGSDAVTSTFSQWFSLLLTIPLAFRTTSQSHLHPQPPLESSKLVESVTLTPDFLLKLNEHIERIVAEKIQQLDMKLTAEQARRVTELQNSLVSNIKSDIIRSEQLHAALASDFTAKLDTHLERANERFSEQEDRLVDLNKKLVLASAETLRAESLQSMQNLHLEYGTSVRRCCDENLQEIQAFMNAEVVRIGETQDAAREAQVTAFKGQLESLIAKFDREEARLREDYSAQRLSMQELQDRLVKLTGEFSAYVGEQKERWQATVAAAAVDIQTKLHVENSQLSPAEIDVRKIVQEALAIYDADKTGMVDYALEPAGGQIVSIRCTEAYYSNTSVITVLGIPVWHVYKTPRVVITPGVIPGDCWAFQGFPGFLVIKLSVSIKISGFTLEHIPQRLAPMGHIDSAPQNFSVWGLVSETDRDPLLLGEYVYDVKGTPLQHYPVQNDEAPPYQMIEIRIDSNHGNIQFTCMYRFRVHGTPS